MKEPIWIRKEHIITFHAKQIHEHGGMHGIRDEALLDSAANRPKQLFHYGKPTLYNLAAAYGYGIIKNHPFHDGNKRAGIVTTGVFLLMNNFSIDVLEPELVLATLNVANGSWDEVTFTDWIKSNCKKYHN